MFLLLKQVFALCRYQLLLNAIKGLKIMLFIPEDEKKADKITSLVLNLSIFEPITRPLKS